MGSLKVAKHVVVQVKQTYLWLVEAVNHLLTNQAWWSRMNGSYSI